MKKATIAQVAFLIACGSCLQLAETFIPSPIPVPGLKIGLANIATLIGLLVFGGGVAFEVALFRPLVTSLTNGTFLSPGLILSLCGSVAGFLVMAAVFTVLRRRSAPALVVVSILGAFAHNAAELFIAYLWLIPHLGMLVFVPFLAAGAIIGGYLVGWSSAYVVKKIEGGRSEELLNVGAGDDGGPVPELSLKDKTKILAAFLFALSTVFWESISRYVFMIGMLIVLIFLYRENIQLIFSRLFKLGGVILFSFILPVLYYPTGTVIVSWHILRVTDTGIYQGTLFSLRMLFLIFISVWIGVTDPSRLSQELAWILSPLKYFKFSVERIPRLTSLSLSFIPAIWERLTHVKPKRLTSVLDALAIFFIGLENEAKPGPRAGSTEAEAFDQPETGFPAR